MGQDASIWESRVEDTLRAWAAEQPGPKPHVDGRASRQGGISFNPQKEEQGDNAVNPPAEDSKSGNMLV